MKEAASDVINFVSSIYEQFLKLSIYGSWIEECLTRPLHFDFVSTVNPTKRYILFYTSVARSLIKLTRIGPESCLSLTPKLFCLYYSYHTCKIEMKRQAFQNEYNLSQILSQLLQNQFTIYKGLVQGTIELTPKMKSSIETYLNETLICLRFVFFIFTSHDDPLHSLSKFDIKLFLKEFVYLFIVVAYSNTWVRFPTIYDVETFSRSGDYVSEILNILAKFQINTRAENQRGKKKLFLPLGLYLNELVINCIDSLYNKKDRFALADEVLRYLFVEYAQKVSGLKNSHLVELVVRLLEHPYFSYTAPAKLNPDEMKVRSALEVRTELGAIALLNTLLSLEKEWIAYVFRHILPNVYNNNVSNTEVFGVLKLIVCSIFQVVLTNYQFIQALKSNSFDLTKVNEKAICVFADQKHVVSLMNILLQSYLLNSKKTFSGNLPKNSTIYTTTDPLMISILEGCLISFSRFQILSKEIANYPEYFLCFVELSKDFLPCRPFVFGFLSNALSFLNFYKISNETDSNVYLPLILLENMNEFTKNVFMQWNFLEAEKSIVKYHQSQLCSIKAFGLFSTYIKQSVECTRNLDLLLDFLELLRRLLYNNKEAEKQKHILFQLDSILLKNIDFIKQSDHILQEIVNILLDIVFNSPKGTIIFHENILSTLLIFANKIIKENKKSIVLKGLRNRLLDKAVWNSAENFLTISRIPTLKNLIKLAKKCPQDKKIFERILSAISSVLSFQCNSQSLAHFCSLMCKYEDPIIIQQVVNSVSHLVDISPPRELFLLKGDQSSGIGLVPNLELPKRGFGFFCWIRLEREQFSSGSCYNMCIFTLNSDSKYSVTFELREGLFYYSVVNPKKAEGKSSICLSFSKLEYDTWYFIELYHLNEEMPKNVLLYINGSLQKDCRYSPYYSKVNYIYNFLGCAIDINIIDKEKFVNTFRGQISAVYFIEVQKKTLEQIHETLKAVVYNGEIHQIFSWLQLEEKEYRKIDMAQFVSYRQMQILRTIFICASPGLCHTKSDRNKVEVLCDSTQAKHLTPAMNVILDRGGIKIFFPVLNHLAKLPSSDSTVTSSIYNDILLSIFNICNKLLNSNINRSKIFFQKIENVLALRYLLEEIAKKVGTINISVFQAIIKLNETISRQNDKYMRLFFEHVLANFNIWIHVENIKELSQELYEMLLRDTEKVIDRKFALHVLITAIETMVCNDQDEHPAVQILLEMAKKIVVDNPPAFNKLSEYLSLSYLRIKPHYVTLIKYIMQIMLNFFNTHKGFFLDELINSLKEFQENRLIAALFNLLDLPSINGTSIITPLSISELDEIFGAVLYILLSIDWEKTKKWIPTDISSSQGKKFANKNSFVFFLIRSAYLSSAEKKCRIFLYGIQSLQRGQLLGIYTSFGIFGSALNVPYTIIEDFSKLHSLKTNRSLNADLLATFFRNFQAINEQAQIEVMEKLYEIILITQKGILHEFFEEHSPELGYIIETVLCTINRDLEINKLLHSLIITTAITKYLASPRLVSIWKYLALLISLKKTTSVFYILHKVLENIANNKTFHLNNSLAIVLLYISYIIEDFCSLYPSLLGEKYFHQVFAMLLLVLQKTRLLYCTLPFETATQIKSSHCDKNYLHECEFREGGFVRIILKLLFLSIKKSIDSDPISLLIFFIFRDKESLKILKNISKYRKMKSGEKLIKKKSLPYTLINLSLPFGDKLPAAHLSMLKSIKKVINKQIKLSSTKPKIKKDSPRSASSNFNFKYSPFEQPGFLHVYLASEIIHLLHFESFNICSYKNIIEKRIEYYENFSDKSYEEISGKTQKLVELLSQILCLDTSYERISVLEINLRKWGSQLDSIKLVDSRQCGAMFSTLDESEFVPSILPIEFKLIQKEAISSLQNLVLLGLTLAGTIRDKIVKLFSIINQIDFINKCQPYLILISSNVFYQTEKYVSTVVPPIPVIEILFQTLIENIEEPEQRIQSSVILQSEDKIEKDIIEYNARRIGLKIVKKILKEETENPDGFLHFKCFHREDEWNYLYVRNIYKKILLKCPLYQDIQKQGKEIKIFRQEFLTFSQRRDKMGRLQLFHKKESPFNPIFFRYLRANLLKKMLLGNLSRDLNRSEYYSPEGRSKMLNNCFLRPAPSNVLSSPSISMEECVIPSSRWFGCELITPKGAIYGILGLTNNLMFFTSVNRRPNPNDIRRSRLEDISNKSVCFSLALPRDVTEVVVKRFLLFRQAAEIYLEQESIFLNFFSRRKLKAFFEQLESLHKTVKIVKDPEEYFEVEKYIERWKRGEMTNFQYLLLLNKYGGRSFNDLYQYPIFPWILQDFVSKLLDLSRTECFRNLELPTTVISRIKEENIDKKFNSIIREFETYSCQNGSHYMPGRVVLGYLNHVEPFAKKLVEYENGLDAPERMFHYIKYVWENICVDNGDNKELIPEFFYCPYIFGNYNNYLFGKSCVNEYTKKSGKTLPKVVVDQMILPAWARDPHHFIQMHVLALESLYASTKLPCWVEIVFGPKQQDANLHNVFRLYCDEKYVVNNRKKITKEVFAQIQEFGTNPIKLFRLPHLKKTTHSLNLYNFLQIPNYSLIESKHYNSINTYFLIEKLRNDPKSLYIENQVNKQILIDIQRKMVLDDEAIVCGNYNGALLIYDKTCSKLKNQSQFSFGNISCICSDEKEYLFSGGMDGTLIKWRRNPELEAEA